MSGLVALAIAIAASAAEVSVSSFGAAGQGLIDDAPAIQRAIDAALPGDTVSIPAGDYLIGSPVRLKSAVRIAGTGPSTVLRFTGNGPGVLVGTDVHDIRVSDLSIQGSGTDDGVEDHGGVVLNLETGTGEVPADLVVERIRVEGLRCSGVTIHGNGTVVATDVTVRDCAFEDLGMQGVLGYFARRVLVDHCRFANMGRAGTIFARCGDITVRDCFVRTTGWHGIEVGDESEGFCIEGNAIEDSGDHAGILAEQAAHRGTIAHNRITAPRFRGIQLNNKPAVAAVREVTVTENIIDMRGSAEQPGILIYGDTTYTVDDCHVSGNTVLGGQTGIEAHYLRRCRLEHNILRDQQQAMKLVFLSQVVISDNLISGCLTGGISVAPYAEIFTNSEVAITGNTILSSAQPAPDAGISLTALAGGHVEANWVRGFARALVTADCSDLSAAQN